MIKKLPIFLLVGLLLLSCSDHVKMSEKEMTKKFKEFAQNDPELNADENIAFKHICTYPHKNVEEYGSPIQTCYIDEMTDREASLVAELVWASRVRQQRGRIYIAALSQEPSIQQMRDWYGNSPEDSVVSLYFQKTEIIISKLRDNLYNKMTENNIRELAVYDIYGSSGLYVSAIVDNLGNIRFIKSNQVDFQKIISSCFSSNSADDVSLENIAYTFAVSISVQKKDYNRFSSIARSFLNFQITQGNEMFLNGEKIRAGSRNSHIDSKLDTDSLSSVGRYIYEWSDSIVSTEAGNTIRTNGFTLVVQ